MEKGDFVCVAWVDADADAGWIPHDEDEDNHVESMVSCGRFVSQGPKFITLSFCWNKEADEWLSKHRIPIDWIVGEPEVLRRL